MAKFNYYQHSARRYSKDKYTKKNEQRACEEGFKAGFELAVKSLKECKSIKDNENVKIWIDVWSNTLTDESEWDY